MLYTLFSPAEGKHPGGIEAPGDDLLFGLSARYSILKSYASIIDSGDDEAIKALFGIKKEAEITPYLVDVFDSPRMAAIERYNGVAYEYLDYNSLDPAQQDYLRRNTLIFSNLYGPLRGGDLIANYKVKQGNAIGDIIPEQFYRDAFTTQLDELLQEHDVLDLRAGYYDKFYKITKPYTTLKFIKGGKVVSHWAKAYRGIVLRHLALNAIDSLEAFMAMEIEGLAVKDIKKIRNKTEIVYDIV